jgi:hypothetical protein
MRALLILSFLGNSALADPAMATSPALTTEAQAPLIARLQKMERTGIAITLVGGVLSAAVVPFASALGGGIPCPLGQSGPDCRANTAYATAAVGGVGIVLLAVGTGLWVSSAKRQFRLTAPSNALHL